MYPVKDVNGSKSKIRFTEIFSGKLNRLTASILLMGTLVFHLMPGYKILQNFCIPAAVAVAIFMGTQFGIGKTGALYGLPDANDKVGKPLAPWTEGLLDIHHINTGEGDATFIIMPDGTTLLVDAGDGSEFITRPAFYKAPRRPDSTLTPGEWVGRYILARHPDSSEPALDYALMTHFHSDHISGIEDVFQKISILTLLDRGWPEYELMNGSMLANPERMEYFNQYLQFVRKAEEKGTNVEQFEAGRNDQITLIKNRKQFPDFHIRNLAVNGEAWTGSGSNRRSLYLEGQPMTENQASTAMVMRYGNFSYFTAGDLNSDMEKAIAWVTGPVDVHVANHHGSQAHPFFLRVLRPRVHIVQVWATIQPRADVFERLYDESIYPGPRDIFLTNGMWNGRKEHLVRVYDEKVAEKYVSSYMGNLAADQGHIVVRVEQGGKRYRIYMLDDTSEEFRVTSVHGPYNTVP